MRRSGNQLYASSARREITPPVGTPLSGFIARLGTSTAIADTLFTRALVLTHKDTTLVLLQMDLLGLARWHVDEIRRSCQTMLGIPRECVLISTTHTHSGPGMLPLRGCLVASLEYQWSVVKKSVKAIEKAYKSRRPARLFCNRIPFRLGINRRQQTREGVVLGVDPRKPAPKYLDVAEVRMRGGGSCILFSHAAHPYILGGDQTFISGDFPSFASRSIEQSPNTTAMFLNGFAGDIAPLGAFEGLNTAKEEGQRLAASVVTALSKNREIKSIPLKALSEQVCLPYAQLPTLDEVERMRFQQESTVRATERTDPAVTAKIRSALDDWAESMKKVIGGKIALDPVFCEVQVFRLGDLVLLAIAGEPFFETGRQIFRNSIPNTWTLGYCNTYVGYLPTRRAFQEGGYEVTDSFRYLGMWQLQPSCERLIVEAARNLLRHSGWRSSDKLPRKRD